MYLRRSETGWVALAPAKLNLFLEVAGRRADGFHELETLMVPVRLFDRLSLTVLPLPGEQAGRIELATRWSIAENARRDSPLGSDLDQFSGPSNLIVRALQLLQESSGCRQGARVELTKRIPVGAGLGGGSSDAAAALVLANHAWRLGWNRDELSEVAGRLGSDVPFFLAGGPAVCRGRGELVERVAGLTPLHFVVAKLPAALSTADVFAAWDSATPSERPAGGLRDLLGALRDGRLGSLRQFMTNHLESAATRLLPRLARVRDAFAQLDLVGSQLTGSGSAYFGVCRNRAHARRMAAILRGRLSEWCYATCVSR
jgi:4-diphosphocytidyl-2-C-methyl-D-erythritol kinase